MTTDDMRRAMGLPATVAEADVIAAYDAMTAGFAVATSAVEIVTLDEVKEFVRVDGDYEDAILNIIMSAAIEAVTGHADGWDGHEPVPARIKLAVLTHVARAFDSRGDDADLPTSAARLLNPLRRLEI